MDIYPQDLGPQGQKVLQAREMLSYSDTDAPWPAWIVGAAVAGSGTLLALSVLKMVHSTGADWLGVLASCLIAIPVALVQHSKNTRLRLRLRTEGPLTVAEVQCLLAADMDPLQGRYLKLALSAVGTPPPPEAESQTRVREAVRALGESIAGLPLSVTSGARDDPAALQAQAEKLSQGADAEPDPVITASLRRRVEALRRQAETATRTNTLLRRNEALRQEVACQIGALQTSLTALRVGGTQAVYELAGVAASIQQVALEAGALTQARSEIGDTVTAQTLTRG